MKHNDLVKKHMTTNVITITETTKLSEARRIFIENKIHHLPVVQGDNELIGMLSYNDLLRVDSGTLYQQDGKQADALIDSMSSVSDAMTSDVLSLKANETIRDATNALYKASFHSLPVTDNHKIIGIVTSNDLLKYFLGQY